MAALSTKLGYLSLPEGNGPGIVLVHDVWGLYDHFEDLARRLSAAGFVALAVDLYRSLDSRPDPGDPGAWMRNLSDPDVLASVQEAADFLREHPRVVGRGVGVAGFCMGGAYALLAGSSVSGVAAIAPFYGILSYQTGLYSSEHALDPKKKPIAPLDAARRLRCPMMGFYGKDDPFVSLADVRELERRARETSQPADVHVYDDAGHAFVNDTRPQSFRPEAARDAWARMLAFFHRHLDPGEQSA